VRIDTVEAEICQEINNLRDGCGLKNSAFASLCRIVGFRPMRTFSHRKYDHPLLGSATLDRLRHNAYCLGLDGPSYRAPKLLPKSSQKTVAQKESKSTTV
jgi:hypothetical protein